MMEVFAILGIAIKDINQRKLSKCIGYKYTSLD